MNNHPNKYMFFLRFKNRTGLSIITYNFWDTNHAPTQFLETQYLRKLLLSLLIIVISLQEAMSFHRRKSQHRLTKQRRSPLWSSQPVAISMPSSFKAALLVTDFVTLDFAAWSTKMHFPLLELFPPFLSSLPFLVVFWTCWNKCGTKSKQ